MPLRSKHIYQHQQNDNIYPAIFGLQQFFHELTGKEFFISNKKKKADHAEKVKNIPAVYRSPADTAVVKINTQHFSDIIQAALQ